VILDEAHRARLVELATTEYEGFNPVHMAEELAEDAPESQCVSAFGAILITDEDLAVHEPESRLRAGVGHPARLANRLGSQPRGRPARMSVDQRVLERSQLEGLLVVGRRLVAELDLDAVLMHVLDAARELTAARYAALGVLDAKKTELERFLYVGIDEETRRRIGPLPRGHGILGELITNPRPLRLDRIGDHPRSYGFPAEHPTMTTFVGAPITVRGEVYGNIYLTEKEGGDPFDEQDEQLLVVLAEWSAIAINNARTHEELRRGRKTGHWMWFIFPQVAGTSVGIGEQEWYRFNLQRDGSSADVVRLSASGPLQLQLVDAEGALAAARGSFSPWNARRSASETTARRSSSK